MDLRTYSQKHLSKIERRLEQLLQGGSDDPIDTLYEAMRYATLGGGKRFRPLVCIAASELSGQSDASPAVLDAACSIELVHCFSLVHDDLPALDDDDLRRGKPSCHKTFGEATALLAGDGLFAIAFSTLANISLDSKTQSECFRVVSEAVCAMVQGQMLDIASESLQIEESRLEKMHRLKTGALIGAACELGALVSGCSDSIAKACASIGAEMGHLFQIHDDILDATARTESLGKTVGSDKAKAKATYVQVFGVEAARRILERRSQSLMARVRELGEHSAALGCMARAAFERTY